MGGTGWIKRFQASERQLEMDEHAMRTIASDIILIAIAILVPTLMLMPTTWQRFLVCLKDLPREDRKTVLSTSLIFVAIPGFCACITWIALVIDSTGWFYQLPYIAFLALLILNALLIPLAVFFAFKWIWNKLRGRETTGKRKDLSKEATITSSLACFALLTIPFLMFVMFASIKAAIGVSIGWGDPREDFEFARAFIIVALMAFSCGLTYLGTSYFLEFIGSKPGSQNDDCC